MLPYLMDFLGFGRDWTNIDYVFKAGVKLMNIVCRTIMADKSFNIPFQKCGNECDQHDPTKDLYFGFYQTIQPNKFVGDEVQKSLG